MPFPRASMSGASVGVIQIGGPQVSSSAQVPAPVGGWNQLDSIAAMPATDALLLDNMFATTKECIVRKGFVSYATGMNNQVETLMKWGGPSAEKLLAANAGNVYDISSSGAVGAPLASGFTNDRFQHVNFGTPGGQFIFACNGADTPWNFNGTTISTSPAITGIDPTTIKNVGIFKNRLFFVLNNSLTYAYLAVNSIGGAASTVDLSSLFALGGSLAAIGTWSRGGLSTQDDLIIFLTSMGEFAVFSGSDPADATSWNLENKARTGAPVGNRCMTKLGPDLYVVTLDGLVALSQILFLDRIDTSVSVSKKIGTAVNDAVADFGSLFGWQAFLYPKGNVALVNAPSQEGAVISQFVVNTATGAWSRFIGLNANCWELYNENPYFGGTDGTVYQWDKGYTDNGAAISWESRSAFIHMGVDGQNKRWTLVRPIFRTPGAVSVMMALEVDYQLLIPTATASTPASNSEWDTALWDLAPWADPDSVILVWGGATGIGRVAAIHMKGTTSTALSWVGTDMIFDEGGLI